MPYYTSIIITHNFVMIITHNFVMIITHNFVMIKTHNFVMIITHNFVVIIVHNFSHFQELHDMFYDMMLLVEDQVSECGFLHLLAMSLLSPFPQGDLVDSIEFNVERAAGYVEQGAKETARARIYHAKNTRV